MHIVVFPGWYPGRVDKLSGDFIQRHMHAVAGYCKVSVVFPVKDHSISKKDIVTIKNGNLTEIYYYYPSLSSIKWLDNLLSFICYNYYGLQAAKTLNKEERITLVQLYVLQKNQLVGFLLQRIYRIPYVVSEQSTVYVDGRFDNMSRMRKAVCRWVFTKSASFHAVSNYLLNALQQKLRLKNKGVVISNVVDASLFYFNNNLTADRVTFVHVSNMTHQKNVEGMLQAFALVKKATPNFLLHLVGGLPCSLRALIDELELASNVIIRNERNYEEVAAIMQQSDVFVLFTRHETFGCVIIEANACGLPVIVTELEVTRELISENVNGVFVETENIKQLSDKILYMIKNHQKFDPLAISLQTRSRFNYERIGRQFFDWFRSIHSHL
ncbi:MAG: glycosyltransferase family 4 protein [Bacteroidota bacterium]|nr:glycosyltransferase family 4 protein [Bacteroidota bacterium]